LLAHFSYFLYSVTAGSDKQVTSLMSCGNPQLWSCSTNTDTGRTNNEVKCSEHSLRGYCTCAVNCMLSRSVPRLADTGNCIQHTCIHTQCMMLSSVTGQYSVLTVPWPNWKYCHDIFEESLNKTTKYESDYRTGFVSVPARSHTVSGSTLTPQLCYLVLVLCTSHTAR